MINSKSLKNLDKRKTFKDRPHDINRKGKPDGVVKTLLEQIELKYGKRGSKEDAIKMLEYIETLPVSKLAEFVKDDTIPAIVQAYGRLILTGDGKDFRRVSGAEIVKDRIHGKTQTFKVENIEQPLFPDVTNT